MRRYESQKTEERKSFFKKKITYFRQCWNFAPPCGPSLSCGQQGILTAAASLVGGHGLSSCGPWALVHRLRSSGTWAYLLDGMWDLSSQMWNQTRKHLHWQVDSYPLHHQGSLRKERFLKAAFESLDLATPKPNLGVFIFLNKSSQFFFFSFSLSQFHLSFCYFQSHTVEHTCILMITLSESH